MGINRNCEGVTRRDCLQLGLGALAGASFVDLLRMSGQANENSPAVPTAKRPANS